MGRTDIEIRCPLTKLDVSRRVCVCVCLCFDGDGLELHVRAVFNYWIWG